MLNKVYGVSKNWSEMREKTLDTNNADAPIPFDGSDNGEQVDKMMSKANAEVVLVRMLENLNDREKIILLYQIIKYFGYEMTQESLAKTLNFSRISYIALWKKVKSKCEKVYRSSGF